MKGSMMTEEQLISRRRVLAMGAAGLTATGLAGAGLATAPAALAAVATGPTGVHAPYAMVADAATGVDIWSRSSTTPRPMGSVTKVMTAYVVLKANQLSKVITVPKGAATYVTNNFASSAGLVPGEQLTIRELLIAMLLPSGCDASYTLANYYGPGLPNFVAKMNAAAKALGLGHSKFADPSGLSIPTATSTESSAGNLVTLGRATMQFKDFREIVAMHSYHLAAGAGHNAHSWTNLNPLLNPADTNYYPGAIGIKTGFTSAAGDCLLFAATRGTKSLIGVALDSSSSLYGLDVAASDAVKMLNWGFAHYK
jgi:D-alanyl-D-alanine carboxypeptidase (penicillin-binding protein 5/6)